MTGENVITYRGHKGSVNAVAWSPDGYRIASGGDDGTVQIWLSSNASQIDIVPRECCGSVTAIAWSPNGQAIAVGTQDGDVNTISASGNSYYFMSNPNGNKVHTGAVTALAWSPDSISLASAGNDGVKIEGGPVLLPYSGPPDRFFELNGLAWSPDGKLIAYAYFDGGSAGIGDVVVNAITQGNAVTKVFSYTFPVPSSLAWACNSNYLAVGEAAGQVDILEVSSKKIIYSYTNYAKAVNAVAWSPDGTKIASASDDGTVKVWQAPVVRCNT